MEAEEQMTAALLNHVDEDDMDQDDNMVKHYLQSVNPWFERYLYIYQLNCIVSPVIFVN